MRTLGLCLAICILATVAFAQYTPPPNAWERRTPQQAKFDATKLQEAIDFAIASESKAPRDLQLAHFQTFGREPYGEPIGQFKERGAATGLIIRNGYIVAEWGDPARRHDIQRDEEFSLDNRRARLRPQAHPKPPGQSG